MRSNIRLSFPAHVKLKLIKTKNQHDVNTAKAGTIQYKALFHSTCEACFTFLFPSFLEKVSRSYKKACLENGIFYLACQGRKILNQRYNLIETKNQPDVNTIQY